MVKGGIKMTENVRKVFDILGVEPNEEFKINDGLYDFCNTFFISEDLTIFDNDNERRILLQKLLNGSYKIIKLPKEPKKKKLRDWTMEEYKKWLEKNCGNCKNCNRCIFNNVMCSMENQCWVKHKYLYSDAFLNKNKLPVIYDFKKQI